LREMPAVRRETLYAEGRRGDDRGRRRVGELHVGPDLTEPPARSLPVFATGFSHPARDDRSGRLGHLGLLWEDEDWSGESHYGGSLLLDGLKCPVQIIPAPPLP